MTEIKTIRGRSCLLRSGCSFFSVDSGTPEKRNEALEKRNGTSKKRNSRCGRGSRKW